MCEPNYEGMEKIDNINLTKAAKWILIALVVLTTLSLFHVYNSSYEAQTHLARALPIAIVCGLSAIALALAINQED